MQREFEKPSFEEIVSNDLMIVGMPVVIDFEPSSNELARLTESAYLARNSCDWIETRRSIPKRVSHSKPMLKEVKESLTCFAR